MVPSIGVSYVPLSYQFPLSMRACLAGLAVSRNEQYVVKEAGLRAGTNTLFTFPSGSRAYIPEQPASLVLVRAESVSSSSSTHAKKKKNDRLLEIQ